MVLAGGAGRRLGQAKATLVVGGRTLAERAVDTLLPDCRRLVVVSRPGVRLPPLAADVVLDRPGPEGPLNALATGLAAVQSDRVLVLACDLPLAAPVVARLAASPLAGPVVAADADGRAQPLCGRYLRGPALAACADLLAAGERRILPLLSRLAAGILRCDGDELLNVNSPHDLERLHASL